MQALEVQGIKMQALLMQCIFFSVSAIQHAFFVSKTFVIIFLP